MLYEQLKFFTVHDEINCGVYSLLSSDDQIMRYRLGCED